MTRFVTITADYSGGRDYPSGLIGRCYCDCGHLEQLSVATGRGRLLGIPADSCRAGQSTPVEGIRPSELAGFRPCPNPDELWYSLQAYVLTKATVMSIKETVVSLKRYKCPFTTQWKTLSILGAAATNNRSLCVFNSSLFSLSSHLSTLT